MPTLPPEHETHSPKTTVCLYIPSLGDGGAQRQCVLLANELHARDDVDVWLVTVEGGSHERLLTLPPERYVKLSGLSTSDPRVIVRVRGLLRRKKIDVLISWLASGDLQGFAATRALHRTAWVMTERNSRYSGRKRFRIRARIGRFADAIVANSQPGLDYWLDRAPRTPKYLVKNIVQVDGSRTSDPPAPSEDEKSVVMVGRLHAQKNPIVAADALTTLALERSDVRCLIVGQGPLASEVAARVDGSSRVDVLGYREDAQVLIARAALTLTVSNNEGLPNVVLESVMLGTPVVASRIPEHVAVLGADYPYYVDDRTNASEIVGVMRRVLDDPSAAQFLAPAAERIRAVTGPRVADEYARLAADLHRIRHTRLRPSTQKKEPLP